MLDTSGGAAVGGVTTITLPRAVGMAAILTVLPVMQRLMLAFAADRVPDAGTPRRTAKVTRTE
jgi:fructoselysine-6-P-deglycase FrlB-like protein